MKITKKNLQDIIKEELEKVLLSERPMETLPTKTAREYEKEIEGFIAARGVEYALIYLAYMVGQNQEVVDNIYAKFLQSRKQ
jgi:hypothetical protein